MLVCSCHGLRCPNLAMSALTHCLEVGMGCLNHSAHGSWSRPVQCPRQWSLPVASGGEPPLCTSPLSISMLSLSSMEVGTPGVTLRECFSSALDTYQYSRTYELRGIWSRPEPRLRLWHIRGHLCKAVLVRTVVVSWVRHIATEMAFS